MAQLVRAPPCHGGGRGFEPLPGRLLASIPVLMKASIFKNWGLSSAGRASALQAEGHRFEPCRPHFLLNNNGYFADMAQLAEQLICNQQVIGSSPIIGFLDGFPSGQRGQTVNLLATLSVVRIHLHPLGKQSFPQWLHIFHKYVYN